MTEVENEALPVDYYASISTGNRIIKLLSEIPPEERRKGGFSKTQIMSLLAKYTRSLVDMGLAKSTPRGKKQPKKEESKQKRKPKTRSELLSIELENMLQSGQIVSQGGERGEPRFLLGTNTLFYLHRQYPTIRTCMGDTKTYVKPSFKRPPPPLEESELLLDEIILIPGSMILSGEHSVVLGQPAVVLPIPLHVMVHATAYKRRKSIDVIASHAFPDPELSYAEISTFPGIPSPSARSGDSRFSEQILNIVDLFKKKLRAHAGNSKEKCGYLVYLTIWSQIPPSVGLGSSGALCVALAILLDRILHYGDKSPIDNLDKRNLESVFKEKGSRLMEIFLNASEFESNIHGETSGVGPFASLAGSDCFTPLWYDLGVELKDEVVFGRSKMSQHLNQRKRGETCTLDLRCKRGSNEATTYLSKYLAVAAVYTNQKRPDLRLKQADPSYWDKLTRKDCRIDFVETTNKLWRNLCHENKESQPEDDIQDVITCINLYGGFEEGYLKMLRTRSEATARDLMYHMRGLGLGVKYTGAGFGGDIVVVGPKESAGAIMVPNYFPVHFHNINLTDDIENLNDDEKKMHLAFMRARPLIVQKDKFVKELWSKFIIRAQRAYLSQ